jgi:hypothetical protein
MENNSQTGNTNGNQEVKIQRSMREALRSASFWKTMTGVAGGILLGYLYFHFVGCKSGSCAITSNPYMSMLFGGILGLYITNSPCSKGKC